MTQDLTRDDFFVARSDTYHDAWLNMATVWDGSCDIEFDANGEAVFVNPDHDLGVDVNGAPLDQRLVVEAAAFLGDRYAIRGARRMQASAALLEQRISRLLYPVLHFLGTRLSPLTVPDCWNVSIGSNENSDGSTLPKSAKGRGRRRR